MITDFIPDLEALFNPVFMLALTMPRMIAATLFIPFLSKQSLSSELIRYSLVLAWGLPLFPWLQETLPPPLELSYVELFGIMLKEALIGAACGLILAIPFWAVEGIGFFIDNQRGSTLASALNPLTGSQTSTMGIMLGQVAIVAFLSYGGLTIYLDFFYTTFQLWPIDQFFPSFSINKTTYFIQQMDRLMKLTVVLASPVIIAMFLAEFSFAMVNRSAQQLNVFVLSMPVKSIVGFFILIVYLEQMFVYLAKQDSSPKLIMKYVSELLQ